MKREYCYFFIFCFSFNFLLANSYINGNRFRSIADFVLDAESSFNPEKVFNKAIIFVEGSTLYDNKMLVKFFRDYHPNINASYVLVTHNAHETAPGIFYEYLDDPKLIAWFGKNMASDHPKAFCIPLGFANPKWPHGNIRIIDQCVKQFKAHGYKKNKLAYMNFEIKTFPAERQRVWNIFRQKKFCVVGGKKNFKLFLDDIATSMFIISPRGSGYDCHRHWEAFSLGSYPVFKKSPIDKLYEGLPAVIIDDWAEVTQEFLNKKYEELSAKEFNYEKLNFAYWQELIKSFTK